MTEGCELTLLDLGVKFAWIKPSGCLMYCIFLVIICDLVVISLFVVQFLTKAGVVILC